MNFDQENIIAILGIGDLPDERKMAILNQMTELLEKRLMVRMIKGLSETDQEKFAEALESNDQTKVQAFIGKHFPNFQTWMEEEVNNLKQELANHTKNLS